MKMDQLRFIGSSTVDFPLVGADASGPFVLKSVDGLGPPDISVRMSRTVLEKANYNGKTPGLRQVIVTVGLQPDWDTGQTPEDLREMLYPLLTPRYNQMITMWVMNNGAYKAYAKCQVSKMEPALFTKDPSVVITFDCDYGYLLANDVSQIPEQHSVGGQRAFTVENDGNAPSGFVMGLILRSNVGNTLTLSDSDPRGQKFQITGINWQSGDRFVISTVPGERGVWRGAAGGALVSVLNYMNATVSEWVTLYGGPNDLLINTNAPFDWDPAYNFSHQPAYWGV